MLEQLASADQEAAARVVVAGDRRGAALAAGLMLVVVGAPLALTPFTTAPFSDGKLVLLIAGTLFVAIGVRGRPLDPRLVIPAGIFVAVELLTSVTGVDPMRSL